MNDEPIGEWVEIGSLKPWKNNPRINDHAVQQVMVSIKKFQFRNPIIVQKSSNKIIAGHTRFKAAEKLGLQFVPVIYADMNNDDSAAYAIADNKLGELATWDDSILKEILEDLHLKEFNLEDMGFNKFEIDSLLNPTKWEDLAPEFSEGESGINDNYNKSLKLKISVEIYENFKASLQTFIDGFEGVEIIEG